VINKYFNQTSYAPEQDLMQDLMDEAIQIYGHEVYYLVREDVDIDTLLGEDHLERWANAYSIEMFIKSTQSFAGQSEFITKFGLQIDDQCTFAVSTRRFDQVFASTGITRPRENDIIWIEMAPTKRYLFEIRFVEDKEQLFQLGKLYTYELRTELLTHSHGRIETDIPAIDDLVNNYIEVANTSPVVHDPLADNDFLEDQQSTVIVDRGTNPRYSG